MQTIHQKFPFDFRTSSVLKPLTLLVIASAQVAGAVSFHRSEAYRMYEAYNQSMWVSDGQGGTRLRYPECGQMIPEELGGGDFSLFFPEGQTREFYVNQESNVQYFRVIQGQLKRLWSATLIKEHTSAVDFHQYEQLKKQARSRSTRTSVFLRAVSDGAPKTWLTNECGALPEDHRILDRFSFGHWSSRILPDGKTVCFQRTGQFMNNDPFEKTFRDQLTCSAKR